MVKQADTLRKRPRAAHIGAERRRPLLLDAALSLFVHHGYQGTSMEAIASAAGVSKPVVYECFPNKGALFGELLEREERRLVETIASALPEELDFSDMEVVTRSFLVLLTAAAAAPDSWRVVFDAQYGSEPAIVRRVERVRTVITAQLVELLGQFLAQTGTDDAERKAPVLANLLTAIGESSVRTLLTGTGGWTPEELAAVVTRTLLGGLRAA